MSDVEIIQDKARFDIVEAAQVLRLKKIAKKTAKIVKDETLI